MPVAILNTATPSSGAVPLDVTYHGQASFAASYIYNIRIVFGDGSTDYTQSGGIGTTQFTTAHIYSLAGIYYPVMTYNTDVNIITPVTSSFTITVDPTASTTITSSVYVPSTTQTWAFSGPSGGGITQWAWRFGDGGTSTLQNPTHTYSGPGTFSVEVDVDSAAGFSGIGSSSPGRSILNGVQMSGRIVIG
jgi:PKD repeat protein